MRAVRSTRSAAGEVTWSCYRGAARRADLRAAARSRPTTSSRSSGTPLPSSGNQLRCSQAGHDTKTTWRPSVRAMTDPRQVGLAAPQARCRPGYARPGRLADRAQRLSRALGSGAGRLALAAGHVSPRPAARAGAHGGARRSGRPRRPPGAEAARARVRRPASRTASASASRSSWLGGAGENSRGQPDDLPPARGREPLGVLDAQVVASAARRAGPTAPAPRSSRRTRRSAWPRPHGHRPCASTASRISRADRTPEGPRAAPPHAAGRPRSTVQR